MDKLMSEHDQQLVCFHCGAERSGVWQTQRCGYIFQTCARCASDWNAEMDKDPDNDVLRKTAYQLRHYENGGEEELTAVWKAYRDAERALRARVVNWYPVPSGSNR